MAKVFKSRTELENELRKDMELVINDLNNFLLNKLMEFIKRDVYDAYTPIFYERTEDLLNKKNWEVRLKKYSGRLITTIYFKDECLTPFLYSEDDLYNPKRYIHGNDIFGQLTSDAFLKIINGDVKQGNFMNFAKVDRKPFWDDFLTYCDKYLDRLFANRCKKYGVNVTQISVVKSYKKH